MQDPEIIETAGLEALAADLAERLSFRNGPRCFASLEWFRCLAAHVVAKPE